MERYVIDRIAENVAVLEAEDCSHITVSLSHLPEQVTEGDCIICIDGRYLRDEESTEERQKVINSLMDELFE